MIKCPKCGTTNGIKEKHKFCHECGASLVGVKPEKSPASEMHKALNEAIKTFDNESNGEINISIDGKEIFKCVQNETKKCKSETGRSALGYTAMPEEKKISEMTNEEILRKQYELLAERSENCFEEYLAEITSEMVSIYSALRAFDCQPKPLFED